MTGPLFEGAMLPLPEADEAHMVPSGYWKIVAVEDGGEIRIAAFVFEQETDRRASHCLLEHMTATRTIEARTGLNFFHALDGARQEEIEGGGGGIHVARSAGLRPVTRRNRTGG